MAVNIPDSFRRLGRDQCDAGREKMCFCSPFTDVQA